MSTVFWVVFDCAYLLLGGFSVGFLVAAKRIVSVDESPAALFVIPFWPVAVVYHGGSVIGAHYAPNAQADALKAEVERLRAELVERGGFR